MSRPYDRALNLRDDAMAAYTTDSPGDRWMRSTLTRMMDSLLPADLRLQQPRLTVSLDGGGTPDAAVIGEVAQRLQKAVAKLAEFRMSGGRQPVTIASPSARRHAPITLLPSAGNTLTFDLAPAAVVHTPAAAPNQSLPVIPITWVELGVTDLCESLPPPVDGADMNLDVILSANATIRSAVHSLIHAPITAYRTVLTMQGSNGPTVGGSLEPDQVRYLRDNLHVDVPAEQTAQRIDGYLDGSRGRRRIFYLEMKNGTDIEGSIEPNWVDAVRKAEGSNVRILAQVTRRAGRRTLYNLVGIEPTLPNPA